MIPTTAAADHAQKEQPQCANPAGFQDLDFPDAFRKGLAFDSLGVAGFAAPSEDTKSQAMRKVRTRPARDILDNRINTVGCEA
jgi:hypothetical protein